jgi:hypothetical protein
VDDTANGERAAAAVVGGGVEIVGIPPRVQPQGDQVARGFGEPAIRAFPQGDLNFRVAELAQFDPFGGGFGKDPTATGWSSGGL